MKNRVFFAAAFVAFGVVLGAMTAVTFLSAPPDPQNHQERPTASPQQDVEAGAAAIETVDDKKSQQKR
jgi:hypothetical protein